MKISNTIIEKAPAILEEIKKAKSVLLHCHPSPDPDSVGSALAMKFVLEKMGKKATVISGDSKIPEAFMHFPGAASILKKNFFEIDIKDFDLFLIVDSGSPDMISRIKPVIFPLPIRTVVVDHHASNSSYADINLIEPKYPATGQVLYDLIRQWDVEIDHDIAANLFIGIYTDTGAFKYDNTSNRTFSIAADLADIIPDFPAVISTMENSNRPYDLDFLALALSSIRVFLNNTIALSVISLAELNKRNIPILEIHGEEVSSSMRAVKDWAVTGIMIETAPNKVKVSFRSKDIENFDVSKLAVALGGGGHKGASGVVFNLSIEDAVKQVVSKAKELYNL